GLEPGADGRGHQPQDGGVHRPAAAAGDHALRRARLHGRGRRDGLPDRRRPGRRPVARAAALRRRPRPAAARGRARVCREPARHRHRRVRGATVGGAGHARRDGRRLRARRDPGREPRVNPPRDGIAALEPSDVVALSAPEARPVAAEATGGASARATGRHLPALDGVRGLAILMVLLFHFVGQTTATDRLEAALTRVLGYGLLGVDLFFVLSGFLITGILYESCADESYFR